MFRKPRDFAHTESDLTSLVGRPPTPPVLTEHLMTVEISNERSRSTASLLGQTRMLSKSTSQVSHLSFGKAKAKSNGNILNFFKKSAPTSIAKSDLEEPSLFLTDDMTSKTPNIIQTRTLPDDDHSIKTIPQNKKGMVADEESFRYNEEFGPNKRRRTETSITTLPVTEEKEVGNNLRGGPFIEDSDDDSGIINDLPQGIFEDDLQSDERPFHASSISKLPIEKAEAGETSKVPSIPQLKHESTSIYEENDFQETDDFIDDEFPEEGEESLERKWMEEQRQFELSLEEDTDFEMPPENHEDDLEQGGCEAKQENEAVSCPICSLSFNGFREQVCRYDCYKSQFADIYLGGIDSRQ